MEEHAKDQARPVITSSDELDAALSVSISGPYPFKKKVPREIRDMIYGYVIDPSAIFEPYYSNVHRLCWASTRQKRCFSAVEVAKYLSRNSPDGTFIDNHSTLFDVSKEIREESVSVFYMILELPPLAACNQRQFFKAIRWDCIGHLQNIMFNCSATDYDHYVYYIEQVKATPSETYLDLEVYNITSVFRSLATCQGLHEIRLSFSDHSVFEDQDSDLDHLFLQATFKRLMVESFERKGLRLKLVEAEQEGRTRWGGRVLWWERKISVRFERS